MGEHPQTVEERNEWTEAMIADPRPGDRLHEHYSYWVHVEDRDDTNVLLTEFCGGREGVSIGWMNLDEFRAKYSYDYHPGYWVSAADKPKCLKKDG